MMKYIRITKEMEKGIHEFLTGAELFKMVYPNPTHVGFHDYLYPKLGYVSPKTFKMLVKLLKRDLERKYKHNDGEFRIPQRLQDHIEKWLPHSSKAIKNGYILINHVELNTRINKLNEEREQERADVNK